jgi:hypothetical protein
MVISRKFPIPPEAETFDRPLVVIDWNAPADDPLRLLQTDALQNVVDLEVKVLELGHEHDELSDLVAELKLRLFGSIMAGF